MARPTSRGKTRHHFARPSMRAFPPFTTARTRVQLRELREYATRAAGRLPANLWTSVFGSKASRPELNRLMAAVILAR